MTFLTPLAIKLGSLEWMPNYLAQITAVDKLIQRVSGGRWSLLRLAGLPGLMLTVAGRKSGRLFTTPLLCVPWQHGFLIAGSNFGGHKPPVWVVNVRAAERVEVERGGIALTAIPRELEGPERHQAWDHMLGTWPNYAKYAERTERVIPVFYLEPAA